MRIPPFIPFGGHEIQTSSPNRADAVILPLCYERSPSYGSGTGKAPYHILVASAQMELMDEETLFNWGSLNIHTLYPYEPCDDPPAAIKEISRIAGKVLKAGKFLLSLGGDHAISIGTIGAVAEHAPDVGVIQIDAHLDFRDEWNGSRYNHACVMRRVVDDFKLPVVQVGIRSFSEEEASIIKERGYAPFYAHLLHPFDNRWMEEVLSRLPERVYLTLDVDGLDPSVIPGTGTPEPGGLMYRQVVGLIKLLGRKKQVVGADICELVKIEGSYISEFTAARLAQKILVYCVGGISKND